MLFCSLFFFPKLSRKLLRPVTLGDVIVNERGQGLIEYLVIVALVGVATIGIMRVVGSTVTHRFNNIATALGEGTHGAEKASTETLKSKDFTTFMNGAKTNKSSGGTSSGAGGGSNSGDGGWQ